jgi:DNA-binding response OmpR family regulator
MISEGIVRSAATLVGSVGSDFVVGVLIVVGGCGHRQSLMLKDSFEAIGARVIVLQSVSSLSVEFLRCKPDFLIIGRQFPDGDSLVWLRSIRSRGFSTPCVLVSESGLVDEVVRAFTAGADDHLVSPVFFDEVLVRVQSILRRVGHVAGGRTLNSFAQITICRQTRVVKVGGEVCFLSSRKFELLAYFIANQGKLITRHEIAVDVWGAAFAKSTNVIEVAIYKLREKFELMGHELEIRAVRGKGYVLGSIEGFESGRLPVN